MPTSTHSGAAANSLSPYPQGLADRRDALVYLDTLETVSRTVRPAGIAEALAWIAANRDRARQTFEDCNP